MKIFFKQFEQEAQFGLKRAVYQTANESGPKHAESADAGKEAPAAKPELATKEGRQKLYTDVQSKIDQLRSKGDAKSAQRADTLERTLKLAQAEENPNEVIEGPEKVALRLSGSLDRILKAERAPSKISDAQAAGLLAQLKTSDAAMKQSLGLDQTEKPEAGVVTFNDDVIHPEPSPKKAEEKAPDQTTEMTASKYVTSLAKRDELLLLSPMGTQKVFADKDGNQWQVTVHGSKDGQRTFTATRLG